MAITGAIFNSLIYGGVDSADYGVYITGEAVYNAPKRAVELVSVPGRNGEIEIDQGHFENIPVSYPAGIFGVDQADFRERLSDFRNAIMSKRGYQRITDTYHPDEFRMGIYVDGLEVEPKHYNEAGQFTLKFNCKPQRFLTSGEEEITIGEWEDYETITGDKVSFEADATTKIKDIKTDINPKQAGTPTRNTETGSIVSFDAISATRIHNVSADINPIQDLHGYDKPWAGGNGKNKLNWDAWKTVGVQRGSAVFENNGVTLTASEADCYTFFKPEDFPTGAIIPVSEGETVTLSWDYPSTDEPTLGGVYLFGNGGAQYYAYTEKYAKTLSYTIPQGVTYITFRMGVSRAGETIHYKNIMIRKSGDASYEPYSNICPISGWTECDLSRTGFNVWDEEWEQGMIGATGSIYSSDPAIHSKNYTPCKPNTAYYAYIGSTGKDVYFAWYDASKTFISRIQATNSAKTAPSNARYFKITTGSGYGTTYLNDISINYPSTDTAYHAYNGNIYTIDLDGARYGGTIDVTSGVMNVTKAYMTVGSVTWDMGSSGAFSRFVTRYAPSNIKAPSSQTEFTNIISDYYETGESFSGLLTHNGQISVNINGAVNITDARYSDATSFMTAMADTQIVYELATPLTVQLTAQQISALLGQNNIWADTGDVTIDYGNVYPISGYFDIDIYHSPTPDSADATEYEIDTGTAGIVYGGVLDVTSGKLLVTDKNINYYDGETLPSTWISDRDPYVPGTTPSIGAQVVYKLASPEEYDVTATQIDALIGSNYVWSNSGDVTVEYGWNPNIIANPTLFDARPLLMVEGYGNIEMNGKDIELKRVVIGNVSIAGSETKQFGTSITMEIGFNPEQFNTGDAISVNPFVFASDYYYELHGDELTLYTATDQLQGAQTTFQKEGTSYYKIQTAWPALTFYVGTDAEYTNEAVITGEAGGQGFLNQRLHTKVELSHRSSTYAVIKFTFNSGSMYEDLYVIATERKLILNGINGDSSLLTLGHPTYIDCDLGEAYMIKNGTAISLNAYIDLGSDLPSLGPGLNRIDFDDTITELKLRPDWWKV